MSPRNNTRGPRVALAVVALGLMLAGCSEYYTERRETVSLYAGDAVATNKIVQMVDPWPRWSAEKNIAFNGDKMQTAVERYRTNKVTPPVNATTSSLQYQQAQQAAAATAGANAQNAPAAPVK